MKSRIVITGIGLSAPNGNSLREYRGSLLEGKSGIKFIDVRHMGKLPAGILNFDENKYQSKKARRRGTRAGAIGIFCAHEALNMAQIDIKSFPKDRVGIYLGITEHGNVETENEIHDLYQNNLNISLWSHHHNPRTVANNPAGEVSLNLKVTGPHYTLGAACAAGNIGLIQGVQMLQLGEVDLALVGGISESTSTFGIFASFKSQGALAIHQDPTKASRPLSVNRDGIVVSEGGAIFTLERLEDALKREAHIYGELLGYSINSDATDFVLPSAARQIECMSAALKRARLTPEDIDIISLHATGTTSGDVVECEAVSSLFSESKALINGTKALIGHTMGASGALELIGNLPSFEDGLVHQIWGIDDIDPQCKIPNLVIGENKAHECRYILNNSFGMLGINSAVVVGKYQSY